jgi:glutamate racemase
MAMEEGERQSVSGVAKASSLNLLPLAFSLSPCPFDARAIGIFDSGLGGLTVARAVRAAFPGEAICYLGDTARIPYGMRSPRTVERYAREDMAFLVEQGVKILIAACNTVSAAALPGIKNDYGVPIMGVVERGVEAALEPFVSAGTLATAAPRIGVIGTRTTIASGAYPRAIAQLAPGARVEQSACPLFVPLIEEGWTDHEVMRAVIREYLEPMRRSGIETLILGCTHYPLVAHLLSEFFGPEVRLVDSADCVVRALRRELAAGRLAAAPENAAPRSRYCATDRTQRFHEQVVAFMGSEVWIELVPLEDLATALDYHVRHGAPRL